jgi:hypothetical protein
MTSTRAGVAYPVTLAVRGASGILRRRPNRRMLACEARTVSETDRTLTFSAASPSRGRNASQITFGYGSVGRLDDRLHGAIAVPAVHRKRRCVRSRSSRHLGATRRHGQELGFPVASEWGLSENNRCAKYYRLTTAGRKHLAGTEQHWARMTGAVQRILETA